MFQQQTDDGHMPQLHSRTQRLNSKLSGGAALEQQAHRLGMASCGSTVQRRFAVLQ
jgi:hypothetical protein